MIDSMSTALKEQGLALIRVEITGTDFKKSLESKDIGMEKDIERELATLGRKSVLGKQFPKLLRNNKDQTYTYLDKMGVRFGAFGTWAVPINIYDEVHQQMKDKQAEREEIKAQLLRSYDDELEEFIEIAESKRPGFGEIVRRNAFSREHVRNQIGFYIDVQNDILNGVSLSAVEGLSRMAKDYEAAIMKKAKDSNTRPIITRFTRSKLEEMRDYCFRFVFLTSVLNKAAEVIEDAIDCLPAVVVKGEQYLNETSLVMTALKLLKSPDELEGIATTSDMMTTSQADEEDAEFEFEDSNDAPNESSQSQLGSDTEDDTFFEETTPTESEFVARMQQQFVDAENNAVDPNVDDIYDDDDGYFDDFEMDTPTSQTNKANLQFAELEDFD